MSMTDVPEKDVPEKDVPEKDVSEKDTGGLRERLVEVGVELVAREGAQALTLRSRTAPRAATSPPTWICCRPSPAVASATWPAGSPR